MGDEWEYSSTFHRYMPYLQSMEYPYEFSGRSTFTIASAMCADDSTCTIEVYVQNFSATKWNPDTSFSDIFTFDWTPSTTKNYVARNYPSYHSSGYYFQFLNACGGVDTCNIEKPSAYHWTRSKYSSEFGTLEMYQQSYIRTTLTIIDRYQLVRFNGLPIGTSGVLKGGEVPEPRLTKAGKGNPSFRIMPEYSGRSAAGRGTRLLFVSQHE